MEGIQRKVWRYLIIALRQCEADSNIASSWYAGIAKLNGRKRPCYAVIPMRWAQYM